MGAWIETADLKRMYVVFKSHPVWVRGLKLLILTLTLLQIPSHPVWVRGLKPSDFNINTVTNTVAPRVGAWIETLCKTIPLPSCMVAPRVGAWIETFEQTNTRIFARSHPVWVRGLKLNSVGLSVPRV